MSTRWLPWKRWGYIYWFGTFLALSQNLSKTGLIIGGAKSVPSNHFFQLELLSRKPLVGGPSSHYIFIIRRSFSLIIKLTPFESFFCASDKWQIEKVKREESFVCNSRIFGKTCRYQVLNVSCYWLEAIAINGRVRQLHPRKRKEGKIVVALTPYSKRKGDPLWKTFYPLRIRQCT